MFLNIFYILGGAEFIKYSTCRKDLIYNHIYLSSQTGFEKDNFLTLSITVPFRKI